MKKFKSLLILLAIIGIGAAVTLLVMDYTVTREHFPKGTYIENIDVSLLSQAEAIKKIKSTDIDAACSSPIVLYYESKEYKFLPSELGFYIKSADTVNRAFHEISQGSYLKSLTSRLQKSNAPLSLVIDANDDLLGMVLDDLASKIDCSSKDATVQIFEKGAYKIVPDITGVKLLPQETFIEIKAGLKKDARSFSLQLITTPARIKANDLAFYPPVNVLSRFTTYYGGHDSPNRIFNIKAIAKKISGTLLLSNESFSLLNKIGSFDAGSGLKEAFVIIGDELIPEYGGGTCQIATTLYNAVALADLKILQRKNHSIWFNIYPLGRDATVYPPYTDLKFRNNTGHPIFIQAVATKRALTFKVFGTPTGKQVTFSGLSIYYADTHASSLEDEADNEPRVHPKDWKAQRRLPTDNRPYRTIVKRVVKKNHKVVEEEELKSFYKMVGDRDYVKIKRPEPR